LKTIDAFGRRRLRRAQLTTSSERRPLEDEARQREIAMARIHRRDALLAALNSALEFQVVVEARQALRSLELEFPDELEILRDSKSRVVRAIREERDHAARQALFVANQYQMQDNLEAALDTLERVNVIGLSLKVSQDVFGHWCDTCSLASACASECRIRRSVSGLIGTPTFRPAGCRVVLPIYQAWSGRGLAPCHEHPAKPRLPRVGRSIHNESIQ
jgi:hypothetical protein